MEIGDRISELYKGEIFSEELQSEATQRVHWICCRAEGKKAIDIGCSQGIVSILLAREGFEVVGVDIDDRTIEYANSDRAKEPLEVRQRLPLSAINSYNTYWQKALPTTFIRGILWRGLIFRFTKRENGHTMLFI